MKKLMKILLATQLVLLGACDQYKEDVPPSVDIVAKYHPNQSRLLNLGAFVLPGAAGSYSINGAPVSGDAQILKSSYLRYDPTGATKDVVSIGVFDLSNNKIGQARIHFESNPNECGIGIFDYAIIKQDSALVFNLADNDLICEPLEEGIIQIVPIDNIEGIDIQVPRPGDPDFEMGNTKIRLTYNAPEGFTGMVRAVYNVAINLKEEYKDKWTSGEDLLEHPEYFNYYLTSLIEIEVNE